MRRDSKQAFDDVFVHGNQRCGCRGHESQGIQGVHATVHLDTEKPVPFRIGGHPFPFNFSNEVLQSLQVSIAFDRMCSAESVQMWTSLVEDC